MVDPCASTILDAYPIADMETAVHGLAAVQSLTTPLDSIAKTLGDRTGMTYCGAKTATITGVVPSSPTYTDFLRLDTPANPKFTLLTTNPAH